MESDRVAVGFIGEGGSALGEWHEAMRVAAAKQVPLIAYIENNRWALGTHVSESSPVRLFSDAAAGYGIPGLTVYGNDPEEIYAATKWAAARARAGEGPTLIELATYRGCGHAHHDEPRFAGDPSRPGSGYEHADERSAWQAADPIDTYAARLIESGLIDEAALREMQTEILRQVQAAAETVEAMPWPDPRPQTERVFVARRDPVSVLASDATQAMTYDAAVRTGLVQAMDADPRIHILGEDVGGRYGGAFGLTQGALGSHPERVHNMPIAEGGIINAATGMALEGLRPIVEMQFATFLASGWNALVNNLAKLHARYLDEPLHVVIRLPYGAATKDREVMMGGGPFHSQCPEGALLSYPGLKIVAPSDPYDARGMLNAAIRDGNPVIVLEHKGLYSFFSQGWKQDVPTDPNFEVPFGRAAVRREGTDLSIVTYGSMRWAAEQAAHLLADEGISCEVVDLRTIVPFDQDTVFGSVRKTGGLLVVEEGGYSGGIGRDIIGRVSADSDTLYSLEGVVEHVAAPDQPFPYSPPMEYGHLPNVGHVIDAARRIVAAK